MHINARSLHSERMLAGCARYAAADRSDPFAYSRAVSHTKSGIADPLHAYDADEGVEIRRYEANGQTIEYPVTVFSNIKRP